MSSVPTPNLTFHDVEYSRSEAPWDLRALLYLDGAATNVRKVSKIISEGLLGCPLAERLPLVAKLHDGLAAKIAGGQSRYTVKLTIQHLRSFYAWSDTMGHSLTLDSVEQFFIDWTDHLLNRQRVMRNLDSKSVYTAASKVALALDEVLGFKIGLLYKTRVRRGRSSDRKVLGTRADKQNIADSFAFGHALLDMSNSLTAESICGKLPISIHFRTDQVIEEWSGLVHPDNLKLKKRYSYEINRSISRRAMWESEISLRTRYPVLNLRIEVELLVFIAQTGMNLAQAYKLKAGAFSYQSHLDGYQVRRVYKNRRGGEVEFEIYSEFRPIFERYLAWRRTFFPDADLLFPLIITRGRCLSVPPKLCAVQKRCSMLKISYITPQKLRKIRVNWLMRRSRDPALTAEMSQHTKQTLLREYDRPHHQAAVAEITRFHSSSDPAILAPGPATCVKVLPEAIPATPIEVPRPDCLSPAGCLFCIQHRDIDSDDHVWSLTSYRYLKSLELAMYRPASNATFSHPAASVMERISSKLNDFRESSEVREKWVSEAKSRIEEGDYHPKWDGFIQLIEARL